MKDKMYGAGEYNLANLLYVKKLKVAYSKAKYLQEYVSLSVFKAKNTSIS
jgi:hypothetical protein